MNDIQVTASIAVSAAQRNEKAWKAAQELEGNFIAEMLKSAGLGKSRSSFGGGAGEDQFTSFLTQEYANATVEAGGIGLAESIYKSIVNQGDTP